MALVELPRREEWGPKVWYVMRTFALGLGDQPDEDLQAQAKAFYGSFQQMLPCPECREHYAQLWLEIPIEDYLHSGTALLQWVNKIQTEVNRFIQNKNIVTEAIVPNPVVRRTIPPSQPLFANQKGVNGTPASFVIPSTTRQAEALRRLAQSAKYYKRPCSC